MRANERRFIDNALNNTAWAVVIDIGEDPRIDRISYSDNTTLYKAAYPLILAPNKNWKNFCNRPSNRHRFGMPFFRYNIKTRRWRLDILQQLSVEYPDNCWVRVWEGDDPGISVGDMFITDANGFLLSMRFLFRIEKCFLTLYKNDIVNALKQYNVPRSKSLEMKLQEVTIL